MTIYERFYKEAFQMDYRKLPLNLPTTNEHFAFAVISNYHGYAHEWWGQFLGVSFECLLYFHRMPFPWHFYYLYEVYPLMRKGGHNIALGLPIPAECVVVLGWETNPDIFAAPAVGARLPIVKDHFYPLPVRL